MSESENRPEFTIEHMTVDTIDAAARSRKQSWIDTYVNEDFGVTEERIEEHFADKLDEKGLNARKERFLQGKHEGVFDGWVARDKDGAVIGSITVFTKEDGTQDLASIYVDKAWHGKGVGARFMQKAIDWFDPSKPIELGVVTYNDRARAFYRKWGFEDIPGSEVPFAGILPEIRMIRQPENEQKGAK